MDEWRKVKCEYCGNEKRDWDPPAIDLANHQDACPMRPITAQEVTFLFHNQPNISLLFFLYQIVVICDFV